MAFPSEQGLPFDIVLAADNNLYKMQVKTTQRPAPVPQRVKRTDKYLFHVRRCGRGGRCAYGDDDVDIFAMVALDTRTIGYVKASDARQTMFFLPENSEPLKRKGNMSKARKLSTYRIEDFLVDKIQEPLDVRRKIEEEDFQNSISFPKSEQAS